VTAPPTVLVADEGLDRVLLCRVSLEHAGYRTLTAGTGEAVRDHLVDEVPDVILLGVTLAAEARWSLLTAITTDERTAQAPVVLLGGNRWDRDLDHGWSSGAAEVVTGPLGPLALSRVVRDVLDTSPEDRRRRRELLGDRSALRPGMAGTEDHDSDG
jgi:DNA-binding response OmpR family regulator